MKIAEARRAQKGIEEKKERLHLDTIFQQDWLQEFKKYRNIQTMERKVAVELIDQIIVYSKDRIEIRFAFMDEMLMMLDAAEDYVTKMAAGSVS